MKSPAKAGLFCCAGGKATVSFGVSAVASSNAAPGRRLSADVHHLTRLVWESGVRSEP